MPMPPDDVQPDELFQRLVSREPPNELVPYPSDDEEEEVRIFGLDSEDIEPLVIKARRKIKEQHKLTEADLETKFWDLRVQDRTAKEILAVAVHRKNAIEGSSATEKGVQYPRLFYSAEAVAKLPPREIGVLWALWNLIQNRISPTETLLGEPEALRAWVNVLTEGARPFAFFQLELPQQEALLSSLLQWAKCLVELLSSLPENLPDNWESILTSYGFDTGWCSALAARSTQSESINEAEEGTEEPEAMGAEEAEERAREMLRMARKISDAERE